jgi:cytochrome c oxidase assembly protein subunit 15
MSSGRAGLGNLRDQPPPIAPRPFGTQRMIHRMALVTSGATLILIAAGGIVTSTGAGLAVPDWPTTFGYNMFLFPWSRMVGAVLIEHGHRLLGTAVGVLVVGLTVVAWAGRCDRALRAFTATALVLVCVQGLLGGLRVVLRQDSLAVVHGCLAQGFFALIAVLATVTGTAWRRVDSARAVTRLDRVAFLAAGTAIVLCGQVVLGALTTHAGWLTMHLVGGALAVTGTGALVSVVLRQARTLAPLRWRALAIGGLLVVQVGLGLGAALVRFTGVGVPGGELSVVGLPVTHRVVSALLLGLVVTLALHAWRLTAARFEADEISGRHSVISRDSGLGRVAVGL